MKHFRPVAPALAAVLAMATVSWTVASAAIVRKPSPKQLAQAINEANASAVPYRKAKIAASDVRVLKCDGYQEEPTEFECTWRHHSAHGWVTRKTGFAIDGTGWHVND